MTLTEQRPSAPATPSEVVVRVDHRSTLASTLLKLLALGGIAMLVMLGIGMANGWLGLDNLFTTRTVDRSAPVILHKLRNVSQYRASSATFSVVIDVEKDVSILPQFIAGSRVIYSGYGTVDASVDMSKLDAAHVVQRADGGIVVTLPHAQLEAAVLDPKHSHVNNRDRGLLDRIGGIFVDSPTSERPLERAAIVKMERAARRSNLVARAERNTAALVQRLGRAVGVKQIDVRFGVA
jgi:Protein of unknown function (DUF4230)